jgi:methyl-accepting chemotaxis protein
MAFKLRTKLIAGFLVISVLGLVVGGLGYVFVTSVTSDLKYTYQYNTLGLSALVDMKSYFELSRFNMVKTAMARSPAEVEKYAKLFAQAKEAAFAGGEAYKPTISDANDQANYDKYISTREDYYKKSQEIVDLSLQGRQDEAQKIVYASGEGTMVAAGSAHEAAIDAIVNFNKEQARLTAQRSQDQAGISSVVMIGLTVISFILSIALGLVFGIRMISKPLTKITGTLQGSSNQISSASNQLAKAAQMIANGATEQASSVEETSASMEELASMVRQNLGNSKESSLLASKASTASQEGNANIEKMVSAMAEIVKSSEQVGKVIKLIEDISFQTNILALNAAVEAARAGEAGMGFAVVADEVKNLANKSAEAAKETASMIEDAIKKAEEGSSLATGLAVSFKDILANTVKVAEMSREVESASDQQSEGIDQVTKAIVQFDTVVQTNASTSEEAASAADELSGQAGNLLDIVDSLTKLVQGRADVRRETGRQVNRATVAPPPRKVAPARQQALPPAQRARKETEAEGVGAIPRAVIAPESVISFEDDEDFRQY